ncbi:MAG: hypothetical protein AAF717_05935 [Bacteroidota bacterium]
MNKQAGSAASNVDRYFDYSSCFKRDQQQYILVKRCDSPYYALSLMVLNSFIVIGNAIEISINKRLYLQLFGKERR